MEYIFADYYREFKCIAEKCEDTCCAGWGIVIDDVTMKKYVSANQPLKNRIMNSIDFKEGTFKQHKGRCTFLNDDNLCDLIMESEEGMLCKTCRRYPRHYEEFENIREISLSASCPEALRIILKKKNRPEIVSVYREMKEETYSDFDFFLFTKLQEIREYYFDIVFDAQLELDYKMALMITTSHDIQKRIDGGRLFEIDEMLLKYKKEEFKKLAVDRLKKHVTGEKRFKKMLRMFDSFDKLEVLDKSFVGRIKKYRQIINEMSYDEFCKKFAEFNIYYKDRENEYMQLLFYFIFTYYLGAVYDEEAYEKVYFSVYNVTLIRLIDFAKWYENEGELSFEEQIDLVHRFAREVEHSDLNLNELMNMDFIKGNEI